MAAKQAAAKPVALVSPFYSIAEPARTYLYLVNVFAKPVEAELVAVNPQGGERSLGAVRLEPSRHLVLSVAQRLREAGEAFETGSLRLEYEGDVLMVEAWAVMRVGVQYVEWPFVRMDGTGGQRIASFWDSRLLGSGVAPKYHLTNASDRAVPYRLELGRGRTVLFEENGVLSPGRTETISPRALRSDLSYGWLRLEHDGPSGALSALGWLVDTRPARGAGAFFSTLPIETSEPTGSPVDFQAIRVPLGAAGFELPARERGLEPVTGISGSSDLVPTRDTVPPRFLLSLHNPTDRPQRLAIDLLTLETGDEILTLDHALAAGEVRSLDLSGRLRTQVRSTRESIPDEVRVRIRGGTDALRIWSTSLLPDGESFEVAFLREDETHPTGLFALPSLEDFEVVNLLVNLGAEPATVLGQISWDGGAYSLAPITILPGELHSLDIAEVAAQQTPDILGRTLDPDFQHGFLHWVTRLGSHDIIDRLEIRRRGSRDPIGFTYATCCLSEPHGDLIPGTAVVDFGSSTGFVASEWISTCTQVLGPFNADSPMLTYSSPVSWNGISVSASTDASQTASFISYAETIEEDPFDGCIPGIIEITDEGPVFADQCRAQEHPDPTFNPGLGCVQETNFCNGCYFCCLLEKRVGHCQCEELGGTGFAIALCKAGIDEACLKCEELCRGTFGNGCDGLPSRCSGP